MTPKTTPKQRRFAEEYLVDLNGAQAAIRTGYSPKTAKESAYRLLSDPKVQALIQSAREALSQRTQRTVADAMADIRRRGKLAEQAGDWAPAIKAAELEAKHLGAFVERVHHSGPAGGPIPVAMNADEFRAIAAELAGKV